MPTELVLRMPRLDEEDEFLRAHHATSPGYPSFLHGYQADMPFARYLEVLEERARGQSLADGEVPATFLFAFVGDKIVGRVSIRHRLDETLLHLGGHVGYVVVPGERNKGYATEMLRQAVGIAGDRLGLARVLVTCDDDNLGSRKVIEACGGVLEDAVEGPESRAPKRRYWIDTRTTSPGGR